MASIRASRNCDGAASRTLRASARATKSVTVAGVNAAAVALSLLQVLGDYSTFKALSTHDIDVAIEAAKRGFGVEVNEDGSTSGRRMSNDYPLVAADTATCQGLPNYRSGSDTSGPHEAPTPQESKMRNLPKRMYAVREQGQPTRLVESTAPAAAHAFVVGQRIVVETARSHRVAERMAQGTKLEIDAKATAPATAPAPAKNKSKAAA